MACVWKSPNSKNWIAQFVDGEGKRRNRSTATSDRKKAEKIASEYEAAARGKRTIKQVREVLAELTKDLAGPLDCVSVAGYAERFAASKRGEVEESTLTFYSTVLTKWCEYLGPVAKQEVSTITRADITAYREHLAGRLAPKTVNHYLKTIRMFFASAKADNLLAEDPTEFVKTLKNTAEKARRPFTLQEVGSILAVADEEWRSMIRFGLYTGQRLGDVANLTWENVDILRREIRLQTSKTAKRLVLPMAPGLARHISALAAGKDKHAPIHPRAFATYARQKGSGGLSNQFADILAEAGLRKKQAHRKVGARVTNELSFHSLRHTATSLLREAGIAPALARAFIGHDSADMHEQYVDVGNETLQRVADALPDI